MPDARSLLGRWSRLKREGAGTGEPDPDRAEETEVAPEDLPSLDDLGPDSDYSAFVRRGVPAALRRAALRRAWSVKPAIAQHKPLVDYDWDFHAPGYGKLWPGDDPAKLLAGLFAAVRPKEADAEDAGAVPDTPEDDPADPAGPRAATPNGEG